MSEEEKNKAAEEKSSKAEACREEASDKEEKKQQAGKEKKPEETKDSRTEAAEGEKKESAGEKKKMDPKDEQIAKLKDQLMRQMAEFDNFRKRTEKEKASMYDMGAVDVIKKLLPIVDNFERGLALLSDDEKKMPFADGMEKVYRQTVKMLSDIGVKPIESVGKTFDPDRHNAVMHCEDDSVGDNTVVQELEKGYTYHDTVVRYSMVKVAN
ncbi:MAG: nucleotide exchange factor GrpE [Lachnospira sp.]|nr:nucleotide exchange factor GrpE [Lachnospira sp.]